MRILEVAAGASSSRVFEDDRSTTDGVVIAEDTTDAVPTIEGAGLGKPNPSTC